MILRQRIFRLRGDVMKKTVKDVMDACKAEAAKNEKVSADAIAARFVDIGIIYEMSVTDFFCALDHAKSMAMSSSRLERR